MNPSEELEQSYPSVELAHPIAVASYDVALKRLDSIDGRLQTILAFVTAISAAVPTIAGARGVTFRSFWFYASASFFLVIVVLGIYARLAGNVLVLNPSMLFDDWLDKPTWEFKKDFISFAGDAFDHNIALVDLKWRHSVTITILFSAQAVCLAAWILGNRP